MKQKSSSAKHRALLAAVARLGPLCSGTVSITYTTCGRDYCPCMKEGGKKHGPYYVWTRKVKEKTVTRHLTVDQVRHWREYRANYDRLWNMVGRLLGEGEKLLLEDGKSPKPGAGRGNLMR